MGIKRWISIGLALMAGVAALEGCSQTDASPEKNVAVMTRQQALGNNRILLAYVPEWNSQTTPPAPENIPWTKLTHINVAFAGINTNHECAWWSDYQGADSGAIAAGEYNTNVPKLINYRNANHPGVKILLSVGGWSLSYRFSTAVTDSKREDFIDSCIGMMQQYGFDGLDFDWEYPGRLGPTSGDGSCKSGETCERSGSCEDCDKDNLTELFQELKNDSRMNGKLVTAAVRANTSGDGNNIDYDYSGLNNYLDYVLVMTYDKHGTFESTVNRSAPFQWSKDSISYYNTQGVTAGKLVMGIPFYGPAWTGVSSSALNTSGTPYQVMTYRDAKSKFLDACGACNTYTSGTDKWIWCNGSCNGTSNAWISFEDPSVIDAKMDWVASQNFKGGMYWMEGQDSISHELVNTMYTSLDGGSCTGSCSGKECGDDGCGGSCGSCGSGEVCNGNNQCVDDETDDGGDTGGGGCTAPAWDSTVAYATNYKVSHANNEYTCVYVSGCPAGYTPPFAGIWSSATACGTCTANCAGKECGPDGCGDSCGSCGTGETCDGSGLCVSTCTPNCDGKSCGGNGCGGSCGTCGSGQTCNSAGQCVSSCTTNCSGKECGPDGCGGTCGSCSSGESCDSTGSCVTACTPSCSGKECGQDGCGGVCGLCGSGETCSSGSCVSAGSCSGLSAWSQTTYSAGDEVTENGKRYKCKPWPYSGWCGAGSAYEPHFGFAWQDAWDLVGDCS